MKSANIFERGGVEGVVAVKNVEIKVVSRREKGYKIWDIVEINKKRGGIWSNFLLAMNFHEILIKYLAIFIIYKRGKMCYNTSAVERMGQYAYPRK